MIRKNCWEFMSCGREDGGENSGIEGVCPACLEERLNGINRGVNGGRACWAVPETNCGNGVKDELLRCLECSFFKQVENEEGRSFAVMGEMLQLLK